MKVRVNKSWSRNTWYNGLLNKEFVVCKADGLWEVVEGEYKGKFIIEEDAEILIEFSKAPPLGLKPAKLVAEDRIVEIAEAIIRYAKAGKEIPTAWTNELIEQMNITTDDSL